MMTDSASRTDDGTKCMAVDTNEPDETLFSGFKNLSKYTHEQQKRQPVWIFSNFRYIEIRCGGHVPFVILRSGA